MKPVGRIRLCYPIMKSIAKSASTLDMALWKNSSTANNLRQTGKITLMLSDFKHQIIISRAV